MQPFSNEIVNAFAIGLRPKCTDCETIKKKRNKNQLKVKLRKNPPVKIGMYEPAYLMYNGPPVFTDDNEATIKMDTIASSTDTLIIIGSSCVLPGIRRFISETIKKMKSRSNLNNKPAIIWINPGSIPRFIIELTEGSLEIQLQFIIC